jgi:hypothetical protein
VPRSCSGRASPRRSGRPVCCSAAPAHAAIGDTPAIADTSDIPLPPEVPALAEAEIVRHPQTGADCLLATTEEGERIAFAFEIESDRPGPVIVNPDLWLTAAGGDRSPERSPAAFDAVEELQADEWLQALVIHPVANEWLTRIKTEHPAEYHDWFALVDYDEGGEQGSG